MRVPPGAGAVEAPDSEIELDTAPPGRLPDTREAAPRQRARRLRLSPEAADRIRGEIERAGGREVCFLASVDDQRRVLDPRAVARGNFDAVLVAARDAEEGGVMIHNHPSGTLEPSDADMRVAAALYERGLGSAIVDNAAERLYVVVEPPAPRRIEPLAPEQVLDVLSPGGALSRRLGGYEDRPGQREMLRLVTETYNDGGISVVEAGTGTGKSLAYLVPAALWARKNRERTVVSTNTINLQEQLVGKDLPLVEQLVGEVHWALVKGRGNYVSIRRALLASDARTTLFESDRSAELGALLGWLGTTDDGSLSDLDFTPSDDLWEEVRSDADACLRARCPHFQECFYQRARRDASSAELLVVNHHLLFTDLAVRRASGNYTQAAVLPPYRRVVLDEAHNVEDAATSHLGVELTRRGLYRALSRLDRRGRGLLAALQEAVVGTSGGSDLRERIESRVRPAVGRARAATEGLVERLEGFLPDGAAAARLGPGGIGEPAEADDVHEMLHNALAALSTLQREVSSLRNRIEMDEDASERAEGRLLDLRAVERRLEAVGHGLRVVLLPEGDGSPFVRWLEVRGTGRRRNLVLAAAPIELGDLLRDSLFTRVETAVLTSATMSTRGGFDFLRRRLGLDGAHLALAEAPVEVRERIIESPFDFARQTLLGVPTDLPALDRSGGGYDEATVGVVEALARETDGGIFVLFTSHAALRRVAEHLRGRAAAARWPLFVQGEDARARMIEKFVVSGRGILLGTSSFWEGVDVPGHPLRGLIIQKLPFRVPTEPVTAARMEAIETAGGDSFREFMLPHAALRLKQGFGRLVRSRADRGVVLVLDHRIVSRAYGRYLRGSLPPAPLAKGAWTDLVRRVEAFYRAEGEPPGGVPEAPRAP